MKFATWLACWPLLGVMWVAAVIGDSMDDVVNGLDDVLERLQDYAEAE